LKKVLCKPFSLLSLDAPDIERSNYKALITLIYNKRWGLTFCQKCARMDVEGTKIGLLISKKIFGVKNKNKNKRI
jgi:hypothetical protein